MSSCYRLHQYILATVDRAIQSNPDPAEHPDKAFTQNDIRDATDVKAGSISVVLSRLEYRRLVRHKGTYWALGEADEVAAYASMVESTHTANDRFGEEDMDEWLEHDRRFSAKRVLVSCAGLDSVVRERPCHGPVNVGEPVGYNPATVCGSEARGSVSG